MDLPEFAKDASEAVETEARNLIPWLPDPETCSDCNSLMYAEVVYDPTMCEYTDAWVCRNCGKQVYRVEPWE